VEFKRLRTMHLIKTLIVDDSMDECRLLSVLLADTEDIEIIGAVHDGREALNYLNGTDQFQDRGAFPYPDVILLDFEMPRLNGLEVLERMDQTRGRPFVLLWSNSLDRVNLSAALALGADLVLKKPMNGADLLSIIELVRHKMFHPYTTPQFPEARSADLRNG
jgi:CheY-like chemotaxis protein